MPDNIKAYLYVWLNRDNYGVAFEWRRTKCFNYITPYSLDHFSFLLRLNRMYQESFISIHAVDAQMCFVCWAASWIWARAASVVSRVNLLGNVSTTVGVSSSYLAMNTAAVMGLFRWCDHASFFVIEISSTLMKQQLLK